LEPIRCSQSGSGNPCLVRRTIGSLYIWHFRRVCKSNQARGTSFGSYRVSIDSELERSADETADYEEIQCFSFETCRSGATPHLTTLSWPGDSACSAFPSFLPLSLSDFCFWRGHLSGRPPVNHQPVREQDSQHRHKHQWLAHVGFHLHVVMNHACDAGHVSQAV